MKNYNRFQFVSQWIDLIRLAAHPDVKKLFPRLSLDQRSVFIILLAALLFIFLRALLLVDRGSATDKHVSAQCLFIWCKIYILPLNALIEYKRKKTHHFFETGIQAQGVVCRSKYIISKRKPIIAYAEKVSHILSHLTGFHLYSGKVAELLGRQGVCF